MGRHATGKSVQNTTHSVQRRNGTDSANTPAKRAAHTKQIWEVQKKR